MEKTFELKKGFNYKCITSSNSWNEFVAELSTFGKKEKGTAFEELTRLHFLTDPTLRTKIDAIWHHDEVPQKIVDELGLQRPEIGVDLVARVKDGSYWAIQCKFHQERSTNVTYKELSTFFSITEREQTFNKLSHRLVCTSADDISHKVAKAHPDKIGYMTSLEFSQLGKEQFDAFRALLAGGNPKPTPWAPRLHQQNALDKCDKFFKNPKNTRGKIIHPCGSGKSLTGYWLSQHLKSNTVLIAVPSLALVRQTLNSWTREAVANDIEMDWIAVCSDGDVKNSDDPSMHAVDLGIEVDTDPDVIASFLSKQSTGPKILITTYQSGQAVSDAVKKSGMVFDLGVYDEAHKTVGQKDKAFAHLLYDKNVEVTRRVFMTATERQFRGNSDEYLSMDDESIYGPVIDTLSFKAALEQDPPILSDYKIVTTIVTTSEIKQLLEDNDFVKSDQQDWSVEGDASTLASLIATGKLVKERGIQHIVSFHSSIKRAKEFTGLNEAVSKVDPSFPGIASFHVSGKDSTGTRAAILERFVDAKPSLITNARCLTEGVDVPAIDAVLFADPKQSKIDIVQAAGRALRKFKGKDFGYIIVPVVLDEAASNPSDKAFEQIINVISALGMNDERIIEEFEEISKGNSKARERIIDFDVPEIIRANFEDFISNIEIQVWDRLSYGFTRGLEAFKDFVAINGHGRVKKAFITKDGLALGNWVSKFRTLYKNGTLSEDRIKILNKVKGWEWVVSALDNKFNQGVSAFKDFVAINGHGRLKNAFITKDGFALGGWASTRRQEYNNGTLSQERIKILKKIKGWFWSSFEHGVNAFKDFVAINGHGRVKQTFKTKDGFALGGWVNNRRNDYKKGTLSQEKIDQLEVIKEWDW